jgi:hypothetical protein
MNTSRQIRDPCLTLIVARHVRLPDKCREAPLDAADAPSRNCTEIVIRQTQSRVRLRFRPQPHPRQWIRIISNSGSSSTPQHRHRPIIPASRHSRRRRLRTSELLQKPPCGAKSDNSSSHSTSYSSRRPAEWRLAVIAIEQVAWCSSAISVRSASLPNTAPKRRRSVGSASYWPVGHESRHDRARCRLGGDRSENQRAAG